MSKQGTQGSKHHRRKGGGEGEGEGDVQGGGGRGEDQEKQDTSLDLRARYGPPNSLEPGGLYRASPAPSSQGGYTMPTQMKQDRAAKQTCPILSIQGG